ncbi:LAFE_0B08878g1_1 [Lachancea fermentati]|uniref:alpha-1,2-Mannosidase n=1 Tax=Lachancea fermentati TaxID=4955 RepID=A0A1G4M8D8_LACFM|nr:LAFE_0B08878g1_1 [Lachancea fermentati]
MKLAAVLFRRARSVVVLVGTVSLLFYYTFQNEIDTLNSYAQTESLPQINRPVAPAPAAQLLPEAAAAAKRPPSALEANSDSEGVSATPPVEDGERSVARPPVAESELSDPLVLVEKNKYFPLLLADPEGMAVDAECGLRDVAAATVLHERYPVLFESSLKNTYQQVNLNYPRIQSTHFPASDALSESARQDARKSIRELFLHSWTSYSQYAFGADELRPLSKQPTSRGLSWAATMIESLDMLYLLGEKEQIRIVLAYLESMDFSRSNETFVDVSQSAERILGALLSSYELSDKTEQLLLRKATELADFLLRAFDTPNRVPLLHYSWLTKLGNRFPSQNTNIGQLGSFSLEFTHLSQLTKNNKYFDAVQRIYKTAAASVGEFDIDYLFPNNVDASGCVLLHKDKVEQGDHLRSSKVMKSIHNGKFVQCQQSGKLKPLHGNKERYASDRRTLPFYSNLAKFVHLLNGHDSSENLEFTKLLLNGLDRIRKLMIFTPSLPNPRMQNISFVTSLSTQSSFNALSNERVIEVSRDLSMHHSSCSVGAMMAFAGRLFNQDDFLNVAVDVTNGCLHMYDLMGVMPEGVLVDQCAKRPCEFDPELKDSQSALNAGKPKEIDSVAGIKLEQEDVSITEKPSKIYVMNSGTSASEGTDELDGFTQTLKMPPYLDAVNASYYLSSEAIESVFYLYRITGDATWRMKGLNMLQSTLQKIKREGARGVWEISSLRNTFTEETDDSLPLDWFSKTLKYYYLLFADPTDYSLDDYIFTNGGHIIERSATLSQLYNKDYRLDTQTLIEEMEFRKET